MRSRTLTKTAAFKPDTLAKLDKLKPTKATTYDQVVNWLAEGKYPDLVRIREQTSNLPDNSLYTFPLSLDIAEVS